ncbi:spore gernimation protein [Paenibacillus beijingensis]|uniref:Spore gernimation protein n=2 Tax=Paenibacillus beijingensis TaxID=1126833 RepID=A0A0D5NJG8_9BACL|nr:spore gernimation protein [Paenibacillus beijingensis]
MLEGGKIGARQFGILIVYYTIGTTILIIPSGMAAVSKQDAWIAAFIATGIGLSTVWLYNAVGNLFPRMTLIGMNEQLFGKWLGKTVSLLFVAWSLTAAAQVLYYIGDFMTTHIMPETPIQSLNIMFMIIVVMGVRLGLEPLARTAELFFPWFLLLFIVFILAISPQFKFENIQPLFETGVKPIIRSTLFFLSFTSMTLIVCLMLFPAYVSKPRQARKAFYVGNFVGLLMMFIVIATNILVLGADQTAGTIYPSYQLAKKISLATFIQRVEAIMAFLWFITIYFKITMYFYAAVLGLAQTLKLKDYRALTLPLGMIAVVLSLVVYPNTAYLKKWNMEIWLPDILIVGLLYPLLLLGLGKLRNHGKG